MTFWMAVFGTISMISFCGPRRFVSGPFQFCSVMAVKSESSDPIQQLHAYFDTAPKILKLCFKNFCLLFFVCLWLVCLCFTLHQFVAAAMQRQVINAKNLGEHLNTVFQDTDKMQQVRN